jgi:tetratricopeptide (TPR) repeat protein
LAAEAYSPGEEPQPLLAMQGRVYMDLKRFDEAAKVFDAACAREPDCADLLTLFAEARAAQGQTDAAIAIARRAQSLAPEHAGSRFLLKRLDMPRSPDGDAQTAGRSAENAVRQR